MKDLTCESQWTRRCSKPVAYLWARGTTTAYYCEDCHLWLTSPPNPQGSNWMITRIVPEAPPEPPGKKKCDCSLWTGCQDKAGHY